MTGPEDSLRQSWHSNAVFWTDAVRNDAIESRRLGTDDAIVAAVLACHPRKVLDLGCGEGWLVRRLAGFDLVAIGVDASQPLIAMAQAAGASRCMTDYLELRYDEIAADPRRCGDAYDAVVFNFALLEEAIEPLLSVLPQIMTKDGRLFIQTLHPMNAEPPYEDGWRVEDFRGFTTNEWQPMPWYFRTFGSWIDLVQRSGFSIARITEPLHPETQRPLSLLLEAKPRS